jgi:hypothetical protein
MDGDGTPVKVGHMSLKREPPYVAAGFDGHGWDCYAVRAMPDRHWVVLRNRIPNAEADPRSELITGLNTSSAARTRAAELARAGFSHGAHSDQRRSNVPDAGPMPAAAPPALDTSGDPERIGPVIVASRLTGSVANA